MPSLIATLGLSTTPFQRGLQDAQHDARHIGREIGSELKSVASQAVAGFGVAEIAREVVETAERIHKLSAEFRVSTDTIQIWDKGAKKAGMTAEDIGNAFNRLKKAREGAVEKGDVGAFGSFGISMEDLASSALSTEQIMERIRTAAGSHPITDQQDVAGMELTGKSGARVLSALEQIHNLGPMRLISKEDIDQLHEATENMEELKRSATVGVSKAVSWYGKAWQWVGATEGALESAIFGGQSLNNAADSWMKTVGLRKSESERHGGEEVHEGGQPKGPREYNVVRTVDLNKDQAEIKKLQAELEQKALEVAMKSMTVEERRAELNREIAEHKRKATEFRFGEGDEVAALKEDIKAKELEGKLEHPAKLERFHNPDVNQMQRIGAYAALPAQTQVEIAARSEQRLINIDETLKTIAKESKATRF